MLIYKILGHIIYYIVSLISLTFRYQERYGSLERAKYLHPKGSYIAALWHQDLFSCITFGIRFGPYTTLASASKDGELITTAIRKLGLLPVRGSSKKGGTKAKTELIEYLEKGIPAALTIDGPKGPIYEIKSGIIEMAQVTGVPIVPFLALGKDNFVIKKSWDKMRIPKPFTKIYTYTGNPIYVPKDLPREKYGEIKEKIKNELFKAQDFLEKEFKSKEGSR